MQEHSKDITKSRNLEQMREIAKQNFSTWSEALKTGDPKSVAALYAENATFLPTLSSEFKKGAAETEKYFEHFLQKAPRGNCPR
jgi:uncharacterized protein (TIGR02246 family)